MKLIKEYINIFCEGLLKVPEDLLKEMNDWVLSEFCYYFYKKFINPKKKQINSLKKLFDLSFPNSKINPKELESIKQKIKLGKDFHTDISLPNPETNDIEYYDLYFRNGLLEIVWFSDGETNVFHPEELYEFENFVNDIISSAKNEIENKVKYLIDLISVIKPYIKNIENEDEEMPYLYNNFQYENLGNVLVVLYFEKNHIFKDNELGHYSDFGRGIRLNLSHQLPERLKDFNISISSSEVFLKTLNNIKNTVHHELRHFIQYRSNVDHKIGLPGKKQRTPNYDQHDNSNSSSRSENHILDDIEFQTNMGDVISEIKQFLSEVDEHFRIPLLKLIMGTEIRLPSSPKELTPEEQKIYNKVENILREIAWNKRKYIDSYSYRNLKTLKEKAPLKYKKAIKEIYKELSEAMPMKNILKMFSYDKKHTYNIYKWY